MSNSIIDSLVVKNNSKIILLVMDGVGGIQNESGLTELQEANIPNLDSLAKKSVCGVMDPIYPGVTPGSGPSHLALFGYDPIKYNIGRGVLEACGVEFDLTTKDVAIRLNFVTVDAKGNITDRRAGRISTDINKKLCEKLQKGIKIPGIKVFVQPVKEHRAMLVLRGNNLHGNIADTDPQKTGIPPLFPKALDKQSLKTAKIAAKILKQAQKILKDDHPANMIVMRGFANYHKYPTMEERFGVRAAAIAGYPMYRGLAKLVGMKVLPIAETPEQQIALLKKELNNYDYFYVHIKKTDSSGEDGNVAAKIEAIEKTDKMIPDILKLNPDVLAVTADHSTPCQLKSHSWHPVPLLLYSPNARVDQVDCFDEIACAQGGLGRMQSLHLMGLLLAHAMRLTKFGA